MNISAIETAIRVFVLQNVFTRLASVQKVGRRFKCFFVAFVAAATLAYQLVAIYKSTKLQQPSFNVFFPDREPNLFEQLNIARTSSTADVESAYAELN